MRLARIKVNPASGEAFYHLISRTVNRERLLGPAGKEMLRRQIWQVAEFAGIEVITYTVLCDHFHVLVRVPKREALSDDELLRRYEVLYPTPTAYRPASVRALRKLLQENGEEAAEWRTGQLRLMNDVSAYMKLVKQRFSMWHNRTHERSGPVWSDRFKSVLMEPDGRTLKTMAVYIDLNCVRAGMVKDPKDYRYCGYAEAVVGRESARNGIRRVVGGSSWDQAQAAYRVMLFAIGSGPRENAAVISAERVEQVIREGGKLPLGEVLRCRVRYFSQGAVLGSKSFVELQLAKYRERSGAGERMVPQVLPAITDWGEIAGLRGLRGALLG